MNLLERQRLKSSHCHHILPLHVRKPSCTPLWSCLWHYVSKLCIMNFVSKFYTLELCTLEFYVKVWCFGSQRSKLYVRVFHFIAMCFELWIKVVHSKLCVKPFELNGLNKSSRNFVRGFTLWCSKLCNLSFHIAPWSLIQPYYLCEILHLCNKGPRFSIIRFFLDCAPCIFMQLFDLQMGVENVEEIL